MVVTSTKPMGTQHCLNFTSCNITAVHDKLPGFILVLLVTFRFNYL